MKKNVLILFCLSLYGLLCSLKAEVILPSIFGDHMVLQQQTEAALWGKALPGKTIKIITSWDNRNYSTRSDNNGKWRVEVRTPSAGGPYKIGISDGSVLELSNILIGEVWVCSGQSNMDMPMKGRRNQPVSGSNEAIVNSKNKIIRLFTVEQNISSEPLDDFTGQWLECAPENVAEFSAAAYFFGRMIQQSLEVPVGLICSSFGGTLIEPWMSERGINKFDFLEIPNKAEKSEITKQMPTVLYNAMIHPMVGYALRGVIWYQGEANRHDPKHYVQLLPGLIDNWRDEWGIGNFPFYYVQIAPFDYGEINMNSAFLREAQLKASGAIPNIGMACLMDAGEKDCVHPANKKVAGERLAFWALAKTYGQNGFGYSGPVLQEMSVENGMVKLTFNHAENGLTSYGKDLVNFKIAGENRRFFPARAFITGGGITLFSPSVNEPVAVRYAFDDFVVGELFNTEGLPSSSFRTDNWNER